MNRRDAMKLTAAVAVTAVLPGGAQLAPVRLYQDGSGDHWIAARSKGEAARYMVSEWGHVPDHDDVCGLTELSDESLRSMLIDDEDFGQITVAESLSRHVAAGMLVPCGFASTYV